MQVVHNLFLDYYFDFFIILEVIGSCFPEHFIYLGICNNYHILTLFHENVISYCCELSLRRRTVTLPLSQVFLHCPIVVPLPYHCCPSPVPLMYSSTVPLLSHKLCVVVPLSCHCCTLAVPLWSFTFHCCPPLSYCCPSPFYCRPSPVTFALFRCGWSVGWTAIFARR